MQMEMKPTSKLLFILWEISLIQGYNIYIVCTLLYCDVSVI